MRTYLIFFFVAFSGWAQAGGGAGSTPSPAPAPSGASAVESAIVSYEATGQVAHELAKRFCVFAQPPLGNKFLLGTPANLSAIQAALAFEEAVTQLNDQYRALEGKPVGVASPKLALAVTPGASAAITAIAGAVNDIKTQTTQTASMFTPVDQVLFSDLEREMEGGKVGANCHLVTTAYPATIEQTMGNVNKMLDHLIEEATSARKARDQDDPKKYADDKDLQGLDAQLATLEQTVGNETATLNGSSILLGEALKSLLGDKYHVITLANAAAGGGTRANVWFLVNIILPAPRPSYNGGSEVAYTLRTGDGEFESADTVYFVYGYTKWKQPKLPPRPGTNGSSSFPR
ncbi:MAG TPA: hypothetical protein VMB03_18065 [Bryobacteraceae bacterium]|nr:hypothetical protein [Bryobacteraceae bacterium]